MATDTPKEEKTKKDVPIQDGMDSLIDNFTKITVGSSRQGDKPFKSKVRQTKQIRTCTNF
jgi:hypothetical protein